jgi:formylglycine-generating enzyme required for sulfatase activity
VRRYRCRVIVAAAFALTSLVGVVVVARYQHLASLARAEKDVANARATTLEALNKAADAQGRLMTFNYDPVQAAAELVRAGPDVLTQVRPVCLQLLTSALAPQRVQGVKVAPWLDPNLFWTEVDGRGVWSHGEWLELCAVRWPDPDELLRRLGTVERAANGTTTQKYVAFCLIGQLAVPRGQLAERLVPVCTAAVEKEADPGVVMAAWWAGRRLGHAVPVPSRERLYADTDSGLLFVRLPPMKDFRPGSPQDQADRGTDEDPSSAGREIGAIWMSTTEVTLGQFATFSEAGVLSEIDAPYAARQLGEVGLAERAARAVHWVRPPVAGQFCSWLSGRTKGRNYRLPTETEWEYACRAGSTAQFCYGDDDRYLRFFAVHAALTEQDPSTGHTYGYHAVATRMANAFGLFDMHGNVWEICDSVYTPRYDDAQPRERTDATPIVQRGGADYSPSKPCRSASRNYLLPIETTDKIGFRVVLEMKGTP